MRARTPRRWPPRPAWIGLAAVLLALFVPLFVPVARADRLFAGGGGGGGGGTGGQGPSGGVSLPRPLDLLNTDLHETPRVVLTYRATGQGTPSYLQLYVLGHVTASGWTMTPASGTKTLGSGGAMPALAGLAPATPRLGVHEVISLASGLASGTNASYLLLPYPARQVQVAGTWHVDPGSLMVHSTGAQLAGLRYTVTGEDLFPTSQQLSRAGLFPPRWPPTPPCPPPSTG